MTEIAKVCQKIMIHFCPKKSFQDQNQANVDSLMHFNQILLIKKEKRLHICWQKSLKNCHCVKGLEAETAILVSRERPRIYLLTLRGLRSLETSFSELECLLTTLTSGKMIAQHFPSNLLLLTSRNVVFPEHLFYFSVPLFVCLFSKRTEGTK